MQWLVKAVATGTMQIRYTILRASQLTLMTYFPLTGISPTPFLREGREGNRLLGQAPALQGLRLPPHHPPGEPAMGA